MDRAGREQELLLKLTRVLAGTLDLEAVLQVIADTGAELLGVETSAVYLLEPDDRLYLGATLPPLPPDMPDALRWASLGDHPHIARVVSSGEPEVLPDSLEAELAPAEREVVELRDLRTLVFLPLEHEGEGIGVLILGSTSQAREVSDHDLELSRALADQVSLAIQNARLHSRLLEHASRLEDEIGERIRVEGALRRSEERFRALFEQAGDYILVLEMREGLPVIVDANEAACETHGYARDDLLGLPILALDRSLSPEEGNDVARRAAAGEQVRFETVHTRKDGSEFPVEASLKGLDLGDGRTYLLSIERDISQRRRWEREILRQQRALTLNRDVARAFLTSQPKDAYAGVLQTLMSAFACDMGLFGVEDEAENLAIDYMARGESGTPHLVERGRILSAETRERILGASREGTLTSSEGFRLPDAHPLIEHLLLSPIVQSGTLIGLIGVANKPGGFDAEDRSLLESVAQQTAPILRALQEESRQERERRDVEEQLRRAQKLEAVGQLAGGVAHDFNNLLQVIQGHTELALLDVGSNAAVREALESVRDAAGRGARLVHRLLALSRHRLPDLKAVDLRELVGDLTRMIRRVLGEHIDLEVTAGTGPTVIRADAGHIEQILLNLCVNARDAMLSGGTITIVLERLDLDEADARARGLARPGAYARLSVIDTGSGIPPDKLDRIFEPFFTTKGPGRGSGLGLSTAYGLVKQHGGSMQVQSRVGSGTSFHLYFPVEEGVVPDEPTDGTAAPAGRGETVLLAEDDEKVRSLAEFILTSSGYRVHVARNGTEAMEIFHRAEDGIDLVFLDVVMPGLSGREVRDRLRQSGFRGPVLFTSGYAPDSLESGFPEDGTIQFLPKPYTRSELLNRIRSTLDAVSKTG